MEINNLIKLRNMQAENYDSWYKSTHDFEIECEEILKSVNPQPTDIILDVGCGTGQFSFLIAPYCDYLIGVDYSEKSIEEFDKKEIPNAKAYAHDITMPLIENIVFDKIISTQVIQHIPTAQLRFEALVNIYDKLKIGGKFICELYDWISFKRRLQRIKSKFKIQKEEIGDDYYIYRFSPNEFAELMRATGFSAVKIVSKKGGYFICKGIKK